ncbi:thiamine pyrophosphate enzyme [Colletotrichum gloeosporioides Cg-14]|uniref:Thiamine pyrophosphate enzyme n=1 Tax=Colletotrichum gloeosporioides (strain Cg-14) TaxID=1237896 RepID=T0KW28_COLGC|nr:thiamine pyrophosphate enzyme [Colletotrichum gloeosporioides Cg-14]
MATVNVTEGPEKYTAAEAFFEALWDAGVTHCFCNFGSDHPGMLEAMMVAMSMTDGFARVTGKPQVVIVHVDVGTQALGCAVHNASVGRVPLLIFAGLSPFTIEGELDGSRNEYIQWLQDVHNQRAIVEQYCRYTGEVRSGLHIKQMINRALSFATSDPKGPVYLCAAREVLDAKIQPYSIDQKHWSSVEPTALSLGAVELIANSLIHAREPLIVTGYSGRDTRVPDELVKLVTAVPGLRVFDAGVTNHVSWLGCGYAGNDSIRTADVILVLDCDVPWIPTRCKPRADACVIHVDVDPLKHNMPIFYINAQHRYQANEFVAVTQIKDYIASNDEIQSVITSPLYAMRLLGLQEANANRMIRIADEAKPSGEGFFDTPYLMDQLRKAVPKNTIFVVEAITNTQSVAEQLRLTTPGSWFNSGGGGLGWSGGAALGVKMASDFTGSRQFVCQVVGDGSYMFSFPASVYWIAQRYKFPILTIVLNNNGWNAPRNSLLYTRPEASALKVSREELNISFSPTPDYAGIAAAAGRGEVGCFRSFKADDLAETLRTAVQCVLEGHSAVFEAQLDGPDGKHMGKQ